MPRRPTSEDGDKILGHAFTIYVDAGLALADDDPRQAVRLLQDCDALLPGWSQPHTVLAYAWSRLGRPERAEAAWRRALELNPESWQAGAMLATLLAEREPHKARSLAAALLDRYRRHRPRDPDDPRSGAAAAEAVAQTLRAAGDDAGQRALAEAWKRDRTVPGALGAAMVGLLAWTRGEFTEARRQWRAGLLAVGYPPAVEGLHMVRLPPDEGLRCLLRGAGWLGDLCASKDLAPPALDFPLPALPEPTAPLSGAWEAVRCLGLARGADTEAGQRAILRLAGRPDGEALLAAAAVYRNTPRRVQAWIADVTPPVPG